MANGFVYIHVNTMQLKIKPLNTLRYNIVCWQVLCSYKWYCDTACICGKCIVLSFTDKPYTIPQHTSLLSVQKRKLTSNGNDYVIKVIFNNAFTIHVTHIYTKEWRIQNFSSPIVCVVPMCNSAAFRNFYVWKGHYSLGRYCKPANNFIRLHNTAVEICYRGWLIVMYHKVVQHCMTLFWSE